MTASQRNNVTRVLCGIAAAALGAASLAFAGPVANASSPLVSYDESSRVDPDNQFLYRNVLNGVSVLSPQDVWTVGNRGNGTEDYRPFVRHYDGVGWTTVGDIDGPDNEYPTSIFALSDDDVWVTLQDVYRYDQVYVQHWDGTSWHLQDIDVSGIDVRLFQIWADSPTDVWAVGSTYQLETETSHPLILHFDGAKWERMKAPREAVGVLYGVRGSSPTDVWAVGYVEGERNAEAMFLHWDGDSWRVQGRFGQPGDTFLEGVDVVSPTDAWAVGATVPEDMNRRGLIMHWNGRHWSDAYTDAMRKIDYLYGVAAIGADDAWAVGRDQQGRARSAHWDGHAWHLVPVRNPGGEDNYLLAVSADATDDVWAVGGYRNDSTHRMTQHWNGTTWTR